MLRGLRRAAALIALTLIAVATAASGGRATAPVHRIVAVGDLHGDFAAWRAIAGAAGLVDSQGHWSGGKTVLVQVGDAVDRGPQSLRIVDDLMRLQREAPVAGGRVVALVGNHEAMNMTDDLRYVTPADYAAFTDAHSAALREQVYAENRDAIESAYRRRDRTLTGKAIEAAWFAATPLGQIEHQRAWHPEGRIGRWVMHNPAVAEIDGTIFVHGGLSAAYAATAPAEIDRRVAAALAARAEDPAAIINDPDGPLWYRGLAVPETPATEAEVDRALKAQHARRLVIGHTPILTGIASLYGGKLIRIDTGISSFYGGKLSYLEILDGVALAHEVERPPPAG
jgi:hypothetical protein